jgi:hypothetical protein
MDLPLATPKLDNYALREILSPCSMKVRDKGSLLQERRFAQELPKFLINLIYNLIVKPYPWLLTAKTSLILKFSLNSRVKACSLLFSVILKIYLYPLNYLLSFIPRQGFVGLNPNSWSWLEALQMGTLPHLLINYLA